MTDYQYRITATMLLISFSFFSFFFIVFFPQDVVGTKKNIVEVAMLDIRRNPLKRVNNNKKRNIIPSIIKLIL